MAQELVLGAYSEVKQHITVSEKAKDHIVKNGGRAVIDLIALTS